MKRFWRWFVNRGVMWIALTSSFTGAILQTEWTTTIWVVIAGIWWRGYCNLEDRARLTQSTWH